MLNIGGKTLQEIQNMSHRESQMHMRKHHDLQWGVESPTPAGKPEKYNVRVRLESTEWENFTVLACSEEEANEAADAYIENNYSYEDYEITELEADD